MINNIRITKLMYIHGLNTLAAYTHSMNLLL